MSDETAQMAIQDLSIYLARQFGELPLVLLDEYDAPLQAAGSMAIGTKLSIFYAACLI